LNKKVVIKVGGSLGRGDRLPELCRRLSHLGGKNKILIVPGGGAYADLVREDYQKYRMGEKIAHYMAILAMDQYGLLLHHLSEGSAVIRDPRLFLKEKDAGIFIWTPSCYLADNDIFPYSWEVTSDSIAARAASLAGADLLVLLKNRDGIFSSDPLSDPGSRLIPGVARSDLGKYRAVDGFFARYLPEAVRCWIINGNRPERLEQLLLTGKTMGTAIV